MKNVRLKIVSLGLVFSSLLAAAVEKPTKLVPNIISQPGAAFQDEARPGAMIIGMDRTPKGRIWGCWTGTGDAEAGVVGERHRCAGEGGGDGGDDGTQISDPERDIGEAGVDLAEIAFGDVAVAVIGLVPVEICVKF